eukprot:scaffold202519_cov26-Tisochrysis_lutea.AAC.3
MPSPRMARRCMHEEPLGAVAPVVEKMSCANAAGAVEAADAGCAAAAAALAAFPFAASGAVGLHQAQRYGQSAL